MESTRHPSPSLTPSQRRAVAARGNVLVMAGAGTGKTKTLVERCLDCLTSERAGLDELLIVTFTEAAATEMRLRLRRELEAHVAAAPHDEHWHRQLALFDVAHIGTLHSFCFRLVREHFYELGLDPQLSILDEGEAHELARNILDEMLEKHYEADDAFSRAVQNLIQVQGAGRDEKIRALILRLHDYSQTRPNVEGWLAGQIQKFSAPEPADWQAWLFAAIQAWRDDWLPMLENLKNDNEKAAELMPVLHRLPTPFSRAQAADVLADVAAAAEVWPKGRKMLLKKPLQHFFDDAAFLNTLARVSPGGDPLVEDWNWVRGHLATLLELTAKFSASLIKRKQAEGTLDFHDLEQYALKLLWDFAGDQPTAVALAWREKIRFIFVDEYQDINAAQDQIIAALARDGTAANRFLVGDVKQSIYRFRLADPEIFRAYARAWRQPAGQTLPLAENFRSHEGVLDFVNSLFALVMHEHVGGVAYGPDDHLRFGAPETRAALGVTPGSAPRVELLLRQKTKAAADREEEENQALADLEDAAREARWLARHLHHLLASRHEIWDETTKKMRPVRAGDMAILLRSPRGKAEAYAKEFERLGLPLVVARGGFFDCAEILDLLSLLQLLDNPLQDVPCLAVLRSPLVGLTLEELAQIRLVAREKYFWTALNRAARELASVETKAKIHRFLDRYKKWRQLARQASLSECLEAVLVETFYLEWLRPQPRGVQAVANIEQFLILAQQFDRLQRQGLSRFLKFIEVRRDLDANSGAPITTSENAIRLMSIHQSKGLEFPVVALPDLGKAFNEQDLRGEIIFDEYYGLCPQVKPPGSGRRYPSLPYWLAQRRQKRELRGEEIRLLYVALTRARDTLVLLASVTREKWKSQWTQPMPVTPQKIAAARSFADWIALWFADQAHDAPLENQQQGELPNLRWRLVEDTELLVPLAESVAALDAAPTRLEPLTVAAMQHLQTVVSWNYPHPLAIGQKAKSSVTELRRAAQEVDEEAQPFFGRTRFTSHPPRARLSAAEYGNAHHKFLQHFQFSETGDVAAEADRLAEEKVLTADERAILDVPALVEFWDSSLGRKIRAHAPDVQRELPFTARFRPAEIAALTGLPVPEGGADEFVIVQGAADLVILLPSEIWLVDFKTDHVTVADLPDKVKIYTPQLKLYAAALSRIFGRPVTQSALHFLTARQTVSL